MVLYKKDFLLGKGASFSSYIKAVEKKRFTNYYLRLEKIPSTENYRAEIVSTIPIWRWGWDSSFIERVLLKDCTILYSKGERYFTLQASPRTGNLFFASFSVIFAFLSFVFGFIFMATSDSMSLNNILAFAIVVILGLAPPISIYLRDKKFLDKLGSLGTELEKN